MSAATAKRVASCFGLGEPTADPAYSDRGELSQVWRLSTDRGDWAIKELFDPVSEASAAADVAFQRAAAAAGIPLPEPVLTVDGRVLMSGQEAASPAAALRAYEWAELDPAGRVAVPQFAAVVAALHRVQHPCEGTAIAWFSEPIGADEWWDLLATAQSGRASWTPALEHWIPELVVLDAAVRPTDPDRLRTCHRDLGLANIRPTTGGGLVVLDWENCGPAEPAQELAAVLCELAGELSTQDAADGYAAYRAAGGPARLTSFDDFSMAIAVQGHLLRFYGERSLHVSLSEQDRQRADTRMNRMLRRPLTQAYLSELLAALPRD
ncbi:MAG: aminoglycoside phosphotransferase family protein [Micromonosporaceae bacterium]|nr:aminoglycoside phosphotransferase family protein [Micromonosporaceae bacterium]